ncbi:MAG TPA: alpha/beta hydrolase, partial [Gammaproteobacteria bacterium]
MSRAPESERFYIDGPVGRLEAVLETPPDMIVPDAVAVVCHPHPQHQGTMLNKVAHTLARSFVQLGAPALRFNFRGVGGSEGAFADAVGEVDDALAALDYLRARWPEARLWLGGFSFGAQVSLSAVHQRDIE